ncbi:hypothetical protein K493DRAFT_302875 [Basidiobolus meristosporus CBS 931.73]|uniref:Uncharacterized protein n=1 Tax=Basidiobolus meristosporus CBS 931.73 TaxID=1314790 RepID=A0A1Y1Y546_9FUNG|nr:hypothetical protein K493DRAFT_302875 [Basidiobolus meristosporus CBS 931.73]|eukprot:ORX93108.1 hypothetical protein K493DRAFT_302875 [Basidiobolus meristosporus CBS 931.73]
MPEVGVSRSTNQESRWAPSVGLLDKRRLHAPADAYHDPDFLNPPQGSVPMSSTPTPTFDTCFDRYLPSCAGRSTEFLLTTKIIYGDLTGPTQEQPSMLDPFSIQIEVDQCAPSTPSSQSSLACKNPKSPPKPNIMIIGDIMRPQLRVQPDTSHDLEEELRWEDQCSISTSPTSLSSTSLKTFETASSHPKSRSLLRLASSFFTDKHLTGGVSLGDPHLHGYPQKSPGFGPSKAVRRFVGNIKDQLLRTASGKTSLLVIDHSNDRAS